MIITPTLKNILQTVISSCHDHINHEAIYVSPIEKPDVACVAVGGPHYVTLNNHNVRHMTTLGCQHSGLYFLHNHPQNSGYRAGTNWTWFSASDFFATQFFLNVGVEIFDAIIVAPELEQFMSMRELFANKTLERLRGKVSPRDVPGIPRCAHTGKEIA